MAVTNAIDKITAPIVQGVKEVCKTAEKGVVWFYGKVEILTNKALPPTAARVALHIAKALPIAVAWIVLPEVLPPIVTIGAAIGLSVLYVVRPIKLTCEGKLVLSYAEFTAFSACCVMTAAKIAGSLHPGLKASVAVFTGVCAVYSLGKVIAGEIALKQRQIA